jgi:multiple sugar transport system ATP-binding protein
MATLLFKNVSKVFPGNVKAVDTFNMEIKDREFIVLVGPSGCGKTTTLRMVAGLESITEGQILIDDAVINDMPPKDRDIAMVFQNYALYPHMDVYNNMAFGLKLRKYPKEEIDKRVKEAADILGIRKFLARRPKELSGGQMQRVAVGRAIVRHAKVYLFDEPLSNLDAKLRVEMRAELNRIHNRLQTTMIYVTHDQIEAMTLGDRIVLMRDGLVQQCDTPLKIYDFPNNKFVASFIGNPPMNFLEGRLDKDDGRKNFTTTSRAWSAARCFSASGPSTSTTSNT